jgi:O-antigen/teichoic acid export membrane protein
MNPLRLLRHKFVRDTATLQLGTLFVAAGSLANAVLLAHVLGAREQGQYYLAVVLYSLLWFLLNQGVVGATVSQVAAATARGNQAKAAAWLAFLAKAYVAIGIVLVGLGWILLPWIAGFVAPDDPVLARDTARWAWWLTITPLLEIPRVVLCAALQGTRTMLPFARIECAQEAVRVFLVIALAVVTHSPEGPIAGMVAASVFGSWIAIEQYSDARRGRESVLPSAAGILAEVRDVPLMHGLPLGLKLGFCRSIDAVGVQVLPMLFLERFGTTEWVAYVRLAQRLMNVPMMLMQGISRTLLPRLSELAGVQDRERFRSTFVKASLYSGAIISAGLLLALAAMPVVLEHLFPPEFRAPIWTVCLILTPGLVTLSFSIANDTFYLVTSTLKAAMVLSMLGIVVNGFVTWQLARAWPETGVAWGLSITMMWCVVHYLYAAWWFRRNRAAAPRAAVDAPPREAPVAPGADRPSAGA